MLIDVKCPDCGEILRINMDKKPGHCYYCGRLLKVSPETLQVEPGKGLEKDVIQTQYKTLKELQGKNKRRSRIIINDEE